MRVHTKKFIDFLHEAEESEATKVLVLVAMEDEAAPAISSMGLKPSEGYSKFPFKVYKGTYHGNEVTLITSGKDSKHGVDNVGPHVASSMASIGIKEVDPDIVVNAGTAGGFQAAGSKIGSVYIGTVIQYHDRRIPIPGFDAYGKGDYEVSIPEKVKNMYPGAVVSTGSSLDISDSEMKSLTALAKSGPVVKEMEAASIAQVCSWSDKPLVVIKSITDLVDGGEKTQDEFVSNLKKASAELQKAISSVLSAI